VSRARYGFELVCAAACWGSGNVAAKYALGGIPPMTLLMVELLAATLVLWGVLLVHGHRRPPGLARLALLGFFEPGLTDAAVTFGLAHTSASDASLLAGTESVFVAILAVIFLQQRFNRAAIVAIGLAFIGVAALGSAAPTLSAGCGDLLVLAGSLAAAIYVTLAARVAPELDALTMTAYQFLAGLLVAAPFALAQWIVGGAVLSGATEPGQWAAAVAVGVFGLALSFLLYNHAIGRVNVTTAGMVLNLIPLFGLLGAVLVLGDTVDVWQGLGAALILGALVLFTTAERKPEPHPGAPLRPHYATRRVPETYACTCGRVLVAADWMDAEEAIAITGCRSPGHGRPAALVQQDDTQFRHLRLPARASSHVRRIHHASPGMTQARRRRQSGSGALCPRAPCLTALRRFNARGPCHARPGWLWQRLPGGELIRERAAARAG
jgi:drug/metabolite transporter (DMT)-like permease